MVVANYISICVKDKGPAILNATPIDERPEIVEGRTRLGDWEIDTVLGKQGTGALVTVLERKTRFYLVKKPHQNQQRMLRRQP